MIINSKKLLDSILPLKQLTIICRFKQDTQLPFFHQTVFPAYLYTLLDRMPPEQAKTTCRFILPESGKTHFNKDDPYTFSIVFFGKKSTFVAQNLLEKLVQGISATDARTLHNNLEVVKLVDTFTGNEIKDVKELSNWGRNEIDKQCRLLEKKTKLKLWFNTGVLFKQKFNSSKDLTAKRLLQQIYLAILYASELTQAEKTRQASLLAEQLNNPQLIPPKFITNNHLFFINKTYADKTGRYKHISGYHGNVEINLPVNYAYRNHYLQLLLVTQYLGLGKRTNYGVGQYYIQVNAITQKHQPKRSKSLLSDLLDIHDLIKDEEYAKLSDTHKKEVLCIRQDIINGCYQPKPLQTFTQIQTRLNGKNKHRIFAVAPLPEKTIQKLVAKKLSQMLDDIQHKASYGYRPKRNRQQAVACIQKHIKYGNNWVLETDIEDCFNKIQHSVIQTRLKSIFGEDDIVEFVMQCMTTPTVKNAHQNLPSKSCGIPQGSPLSPLIANIVLTDLDYDLYHQGYSHIRFADDFVVCAKSRKQLQAALLACKQSLFEHGLSLNNEKTHITQVAENFVFLGFQINDKQATDLSKKTTTKPINLLEPEVIQQTGTTPISRQGQTLFVCYQKHAQLTLSGNHLVISSTDKVERTPLAHIRLIMMLGAHQVTTQLAQYCLKEGVDIYYLSHTGKYLGTLNSSDKSNQYKTLLWLKQENILNNDEHCLSLSKAVIGARLYNMRKTLVNYQLKNINIIDGRIKQLDFAKNLHELRGIEGLATRFYYLQINLLLQKTDFRFERRTRRPPKDPFNVLLSLGYTILYNYLNSFLLTLDINPDRGFYHYTQSHSIALCSDLIEPFRHWVEQSAITVVRRKQIQLKHFYYHNNRCCLTADGRKIYLRHLAQMLESGSKHGNIFKQRRIEKIYQQSMSFKQHLQHPDTISFEPYKE